MEWAPIVLLVMVGALLVLWWLSTCREDKASMRPRPSRRLSSSDPANARVSARRLQQLPPYGRDDSRPQHLQKKQKQSTEEEALQYLKPEQQQQRQLTSQQVPPMPELRRPALGRRLIEWSHPPSRRQELVRAECGSVAHLPQLNPAYWSGPDYQPTNNCYAYVIMDRESFNMRPHKLQPGESAGLPPIHEQDYGAEIFQRYIQADHPRIICTSDAGLPPCGYYRGALVLSTVRTDSRDFHFYREDANGWSHKPGASPVTNLDASGRWIVDPRFCDRNYDKDLEGRGYNYNEFCYFMWIPSDLHAEHMQRNNQVR